MIRFDSWVETRQENCSTMKKLLWIIVLSFCFARCSEHDIDASKVPDAVKTSFTQKYSNASDIEWKKVKDYYEAEFKMDGKKMEAEFNEDGTFMKEE